MDLEEWEAKVSNITCKYNHFDLWCDYNSVQEYIFNPELVRKHGFYPLIHFEMPKPKWVKNGTKALINNDKKRQIFYAAHIDTWIYRLYAYKINEAYNDYMDCNELDDVAVAYRNNKPGQSNIHFAYNAFSFISGLKDHGQSSYVIIGDFTDFFDNLNHDYLKTCLQKVLDTDVLSDDMYAVFKNITRAPYVELVDLLKFHKLENTEKSRRLVNKKYFNHGRILDIKTLKEHKIEINKDRCNQGVAQGTSISAVLSNVYMIDFDKALNDLAKKHNGFYQRYSDDFIFICPGNKSASNNPSLIQEIIENIRKVIDETKSLSLKDEKRQIFQVDPSGISNITDSFIDKNENTNILHRNNIINYLGFSYDGCKISIRAKTISRYFSRLALSTHAIARQNGVTHPRSSNSKSKKIPLYKVYDRFTYKGMKSYRLRHPDKKHIQLITHKSGNFHDYVARAQSIFREGKHFVKVTKKSTVYLRRHLNKKYK